MATRTINPVLDSLADVEAFENAPLHQRFPAQNALELIEQSAAAYGDDPALDFLLTGRRDEIPQTLTFRDLAKYTKQTANLLFSLGLQGDEAVSIVLPMLPQSHPLILGSQMAGLANPVNPMLQPGHIAEIIQAADARIVACLAPSTHSDIWQKLTSVLPSLPNVHTVLAVHQPGLTDPTASLEIPGSNVKVVDFNTAREKQPSSELIKTRQLTPDTLAACFHTGGTTGKPKIAQLTHGNIAYLGQLAQILTCHLDRHTALCGLPLFHIFGVIIQGIGAFSSGNRIVLLTPAGFRNPEVIKNLWHHVARFRAFSFAAVPTVLTALSQIPVGDEDISCLDRISSGASALSPAFKARFEKQFKVTVYNGYGMTETTSLITRSPEWQPAGSVGIRLPYSSVRIVRLEGERVVKECSAGETGIVLVKGPQVFAGYKDKTDDSKAWIDNNWFNTGDLGYFDDDGFLYLTGRAKDLIIRSGHNIDPELIEEPLNRHPQVLSAIAVGMPDPYAGELPMAFVVPRPGTDVTAAELLAWCEAEVSERAAIPKRIEFIAAIPLTAVGKVFRPLLREQISAKVLTEHLQAEGINAQVSCQWQDKIGMTAEVTVREHDGQNLAALADNISSLLSAYNIAVTVR